MEGKFYKAAITGDESELNQLVDSISAEFVKETPLHIAAKYGRLNIVREILRRRPAFAFRLNSEGQTPLHLASAKGHLDAVNELLGKNNNDQSQQRKLSDACFIRDKQGRSPLHLAAMNGHVEVLRKLVETERAAAWVCTDGQSFLHLCANNDHFKGVEELIGLVSEKVVFINNLKDDDDNNILHLLAAKRQYKIIQRLVNDNEGVDINAMNRERDTVLDVALKKQSSIRDFIEIIRFVVSTGAKERSRKAAEDTLLLVVSLMAAIIFHVVMNPPEIYLVFIALWLLLIIVFIVPMVFPQVSKSPTCLVGIGALAAVCSVMARRSFKTPLKPINPDLTIKAWPVLFILFLTNTKLLRRNASTWIFIISILINWYVIAMMATLLISPFDSPPETDLVFTASNNMERAGTLLLVILFFQTLFPGKFSAWGLIIAALMAVYLCLFLLSSDGTVLVSLKKYLIQHIQVVAGAYLSIISMYKFFKEHVQVAAAVFASIVLMYNFFIAHSHKFFVWIFVRE